MAAVRPPAASGLLVGREAELDVFKWSLATLSDGRGSIVELSGEPGSGKTRLATALAQLADQRGIPVIRTRALRGGSLPLQVFHDAWQARRAAGGPRQRFDEAAGRLAEWAAGCVLVLDDVHLCDPDSTALLVRLVRSVPPAPFLLALAHRPGRTAPELREALAEGARTGTVTQVQPSPLTPEAVAALLADRPAPAGSGPPTPAELQDYAAGLCAAAEGNPQYAQLLIAANWHPAYWPDRAGTDSAGLLRTAEPLIAEFDALSPQAVLTASAAAVVGSPFRPEDIARISQLGTDPTLDALAELEAADLVRRADWRGGLAFRHPVVGHVAHERAGLSFRLRAHRRALDLITARGGRAHDRARHAEQLLGSDAALAARALADGATEIAAQEPGAAAHWLRLALESLPDCEAGAAARNELELACCRALIDSGQLDEARTRAHDLLGHRAAALTGRQLLHAHAVCAGAERQLGRFAEATAITDTALGLLPRPLPRPLPAEAVELVVEHGLVHVLSGTHDQARALLRQAVQALGETDRTNEANHAVLRVLDALCHTHSSDAAEAIDEVAHCARLVDALPDPHAGRTPETLALLGSAELYLERFTDAARHLSRGLTTDRRRHLRPVLLHRLLGLAITELWTGHLDASHQHARGAENLAGSLGVPPAVTLAQAISALALIWTRGQEYAGAAIALTEEATGAAPAGHSWWTASATCLLAHARLLAGDPAGCRRTLLDPGRGRQLPHVRPFSRPYMLSLLATATLDLGDREEAQHLIKTAEAEADRLGLPVQQAHALAARAHLHATDGEHHAAAALFALAADAFQSAGTPVQYAWTLATGARSFHQAHGAAEAFARLDAAEAIARTRGALLVGQLVTRARTELAADSRTAHPLGLLSGREREIAELAATGLRTREIAERLFLSPRTVETHLSRAYRKLDVSSRLALSDLLRRAG
ncbi:ATP/maltotriose-dependent transcriptional regulator MalT [Streptomyces sp. 3211.6]|uniref:LuxR C-terminal-related transcriptional regulator n=1 Tax=Streptomyces sp. 3211.6 TaxID=1938845 RepID=UPI000EAF7A7D|nr:helix-turn-helix transcriptional regulator [Streptomyces sp. 3211.6]RKT08287.1 ATP/maltotriose-dependent transcriptional regulator MalT [Streptomyces sp. 3211.6]